MGRISTPDSQRGVLDPLEVRFDSLVSWRVSNSIREMLPPW